MNIKTEPTSDHEGEHSKVQLPNVRRSSRVSKGNKWASIKTQLTRIKKELVEQPVASDDDDPTSQQESVCQEVDVPFANDATSKTDSNCEAESTKQSQIEILKEDPPLLERHSSSTETAESDLYDSDFCEDVVIREHSYAVKPINWIKAGSQGLNVQPLSIKSPKKEMAFYRAHIDHTYSCISTIPHVEAIMLRHLYGCSSKLAEHITSMKFPKPKATATFKEPAPAFRQNSKEAHSRKRSLISINQLLPKRFKRSSQETFQGVTVISSAISTPKVQLKKKSKKKPNYTKRSTKPLDSGVSSKDFVLRKRKRRRNKTGWPNSLKKSQQSEEQSKTCSKAEASTLSTLPPKKVEKKEKPPRKIKSSEDARRLRMNLRNGNLEESSSIEEVKNRLRNPRKNSDVTNANSIREHLSRKVKIEYRQKVAKIAQQKQPSLKKGNPKVEKRGKKSLASSEREEDKKIDKSPPGTEATNCKTVDKIKSCVKSLLKCVGATEIPSTVDSRLPVANKDTKDATCNATDFCNSLDKQNPSGEEPPQPSKGGTSQRQKRGLFRWSRKKSLHNKKRSQEKKVEVQEDLKVITFNAADEPESTVIEKSEEIAPISIKKESVLIDPESSKLSCTGETASNVEDPCSKSLTVDTALNAGQKDLVTTNVPLVTEPSLEAEMSTSAQNQIDLPAKSKEMTESTMPEVTESTESNHEPVCTKTQPHDEGLPLSSSEDSPKNINDKTPAEMPPVVMQPKPVVDVSNNSGCDSEDDCNIVESGPVMVIEVSDDSDDSDWGSCFQANVPPRPAVLDKTLNCRNKTSAPSPSSEVEGEQENFERSEVKQKCCKEEGEGLQMQLKKRYNFGGSTPPNNYDDGVVLTGNERLPFESNNNEASPPEGSSSNVQDIRIASVHSISPLSMRTFANPMLKPRILGRSARNSSRSKSILINQKKVRLTRLTSTPDFIPGQNCSANQVQGVKTQNTPRRTKETLEISPDKLQNRNQLTCTVILPPKMSGLTSRSLKKRYVSNPPTDSKDTNDPISNEESEVTTKNVYSDNYFAYKVPPHIDKLYELVKKRLGLKTEIRNNVVQSDGRPPFPYAIIASMAIEKSPVKAIQIKGITDFATENFPFYLTHKSKWKINVRMRVASCKYFSPIKVGRSVFYTFSNEYRMKGDPDVIEPTKLLDMWYTSSKLAVLTKSSADHPTSVSGPVKPVKPLETVEKEPFHPLEHLLDVNSFSQFHRGEMEEEQGEGNGGQQEGGDEEEVNPFIPLCSYSDGEDCESDQLEEEPSIYPKAPDIDAAQAQPDADPLGMTRDPFENTSKGRKTNHPSKRASLNRVFPCSHFYCFNVSHTFETALDHAIDHPETMKQCPVCDFATPDCNQLLWHVNVHQ